MSSNGENTPMYFVSMEVANIKCFGHNTMLNLCNEKGAISPWTLILGDNGVGKTTLLKCLARMVPVVDPPTDEEINAKAEKDAGKSEEQIKSEETIRIKPIMDDLDDETEFEQLIRVGQDTRSDIMVSFAVGTQLGAVPLSGGLVSVGVHFEREKGKLEEVEFHKDSLKIFNSPNLFAYGANRHMGLKNVAESDLKDPIQNLFSDFGALYDAEEVLTTLEYASLKPETRERGTGLFVKVKQLLSDLLPDVEGPDSFIIKSPLKNDGSLGKSRVEVLTPFGRVSLFDLSLGYKTMLAWSLDLALRMFWQNPDAERPLEQPAVVIMDEIDLHLHPKWQRNVRDYLLKHFPNTQFICTAHSPFMAQAAAGDNLAVLHREGGDVYIQNAPEVVDSWRIGQFATSELFGVGSERSVEIERRVNRRRLLLDKKTKTPEEDEELRELDKDLADLPVDAEGKTAELLSELRKFTDSLKDGGNTK